MSPVDRLEQLLKESNIPYVSLPEGEGFSVSASSADRDLRPILLAEETTVWLLVALEGPILSGMEAIAAREVANEINSEIPFGAFYVERGRIFFRNTIRWHTLTGHEQLSIFLFTTLGMIDQNAKYFSGSAK